MDIPVAADRHACGLASFGVVSERPRQPLIEVRETRQARFVLTEAAAFFVPGALPSGRADGRPQFRLASMRGDLLGRPIVTIPPEEAD